MIQSLPASISESDRIHNEVVQLALEKARMMELKRKNPFTYLFKANDTSAFFSKKQEEESEEKENTGDLAEEALSTEKAMQNFFGILNGTSPLNNTAVSSSMVAPKQENTEQK